MRLVGLTESCLLQLDKMFDDGDIIFMFTHLNDDRDNEEKQVMIEISNCHDGLYQLYFWPNKDDEYLDVDNIGNVKIKGIDEL